jgi:ABC-type transporter Mla subunit MlaD
MKLAVGLFVIILFISLGTFSYFILETKGTFEKRYSFYFIVDSADSFTIGMPLKFSGFKIGQLDSMKLRDNGSVKITFSVNEENRKWINIYTYLLLKKPLIGSAYIEVLATSGNKLIKQNSKLPIILTDDINDMVTKLEPAIDNLLNIISNMNEITTNLNKKDAPLNKTLQNLERFSSKLANSDSLLTSVTGDKKSTKSLINSLNQLNSILNDLKSISKNLNHDLIKPTSSSIKNLNKIMIDIKDKLNTLDPLVKSVGGYDKEINSLKENLTITIEKSNQLLNKIDLMLNDEKEEEILP